MIKRTEKLFAIMSSMPPAQVKAVIRDWSMVMLKKMKDRRQYLIDFGFEEIEIESLTNEMMTPDGRGVLWSAGKAWALQPEIHAKRLAEAMEQARQRDAAMTDQQSQPTQPIQPPTTCTSLIDGQLCGGTLVRASVCPRCALGKSGVTATLTCDVCDRVTAIMRGDS